MHNLPIRSASKPRFVNAIARNLPPLSALLLSAFALGGCAQSTPANSPSDTAVRSGSKEQVIVERSAAALERVRQNPRFAKADYYLEHARGVMIFPRLVKASLIVGGEGGNGVLVARRADGSWSDPAFYSLGSPSIGLQVGYQQATVVLFIMDQSTLDHTLNTSIALGGKAGVSLGDVDDNGGTKGSVATANIIQLVDAEGAFAGLSLDGYVIGARNGQNLAYYGKSVTPREILVDGAIQRADAGVLDRALLPTRPSKQALSAR
jgi:lipid-binding SYLF domain-containing protein